MTTITKLRLGQWRVRSGAIMRCRDMSDTHLANAIRMCERAHAHIAAEMVSFECSLQGEMAVMYAQQDTARFENEGPSVFDGYDNLIAERKRRGTRT